MNIEKPTQQTIREGLVSQRIIEPLQLYDPLLVLLKVKLRLNNWWVIVAMGILSAVNWYLIGTLPPIQSLLVSVTIPVWIGLYLFLPSTFADLLNRLWENGAISNDRGETSGFLSYQAFVEKQARWIHSRWWAGIALFINLLVLSLFFFVPNSVTMHIPLWWFPLAVFVSTVVGYIGGLLLIWLLMIGVATHRLFHAFTIRVKPLHPDGSGGLGLFRRFLWIGTTLVLIEASYALVGWSSGSKGFDIVFIVGNLLLYLILASLLLITWVVLPHQAMVQARNEFLQPLSDEYERTLRETMPSAKGETAEINAGTGRLTALQKRYEQVRNSFPTWPVEIMQLRSLVTLLILPVLLALLPLLINLF